MNVVHMYTVGTVVRVSESVHSTAHSTSSEGQVRVKRWTKLLYNVYTRRDKPKKLFLKFKNLFEKAPQKCGPFYLVLAHDSGVSPQLSCLLMPMFGCAYSSLTVLV